jgi:hypothetical protein
VYSARSLLSHPPSRPPPVTSLQSRPSSHVPPVTSLKSRPFESRPFESRTCVLCLALYTARNPPGGAASRPRIASPRHCHIPSSHPPVTSLLPHPAVCIPWRYRSVQIQWRVSQPRPSSHVPPVTSLCHTPLSYPFVTSLCHVPPVTSLLSRPCPRPQVTRMLAFAADLHQVWPFTHAHAHANAHTFTHPHIVLRLGDFHVALYVKALSLSAVM